MGWLENSIRNRLLLAFGSFVLIISIQLAVSVYTVRSIEQIAELKTLISSAQLNGMNAHNNIFRHLTVDARNPDFYASGISPLTQTIDAKVYLLEKRLNLLINHKIIHEVELVPMMNILKKQFVAYKLLVNQNKIKTLDRGFKDYGVEGQMRYHIHQLEHSNFIPLERLLAIRRNEKDFILRGEERYSKEVNQLVGTLKKELKYYETAEAIHEIELLTNYLTYFNRYVDLTNQIGHSEDNGLKKEIALQGDKFLRQFSDVDAVFSDRVERNLWFLKAIQIMTTILVILLSIALSWFISRRLSEPISKLSDRMKSFVLNPVLLKKQGYTFKKQPSEIESLNDAFNHMSSQIRNHLDEIENKNLKLKQQNEKLEKLNSELDRFIYHTSHDLRAPLTSIMGLIEVLEITDEEEEKEQYYDYMKGCLNQLDMTIIQIIQFYKNRNTGPNLEPVNIGQQISDIYSLNKFHVHAKGVEFIADFSRVCNLVSDGYRINIILKNLISNAIKYSDHKKEKPFIKTVCYRDNGNCIVEVTDNGIGIGKEHQRRIFEMFYRASDRSSGSGLGLYIIKESAKKIGAKITFSSIEGRGSTFKLIIPDMSSKARPVTTKQLKPKRAKHRELLSI